ncbi:MAG: hypothetical protein PWQ10_449 [Patescibacteria group bacterium]|nr:hypothetical protein [Patescibacteria group bacterium]
MPKFKLNKLVRDKLPVDYSRLGQIVEYKKLSPDEHKNQLIKKIIEEAKEIQIDDSIENIKSEIADIQQVINDLMDLCNITSDQIKVAQKIKYNKKGGFKKGFFVETIELAENDEWIAYYRDDKRSTLYPEIK